jgi:drug/metabolite transporter (DMT)-like permease
VTETRAWRKDRLSGVANALGAAVLFGLSTPLAKTLLARTEPLLLAGPLYLGAGCGLLVVPWLANAQRVRAARTHEAPLRCADFAVLATMILAGGVAARSS